MSFHENFSFHPFFVEDLGTIGNLFARVDIFKSRVFRLFVNAVGTCQLKSEDGLIAGQALFVVIVPNCAFHTFVDRYEHIMAIEHNTNDRAAMEIEELPKFMYLNFLCKLLGFNFNYISFLKWKGRLFSVLYLWEHWKVNCMVCLLVLYSVEIQIIFQDLAFLKSKHDARWESCKSVNRKKLNTSDLSTCVTDSLSDAFGENLQSPWRKQ